MTLKCLIHGHWFDAGRTYTVPICGRNEFDDAVRTYATRTCERCGYEDTRFVSSSRWDDDPR